MTIAISRLCLCPSPYLSINTRALTLCSVVAFLYLSFVSYSTIVPWPRLVALLLFHTLVGTFSLVLMPINLVWINSPKYLHVLSSGWLESQTTRKKELNKHGRELGF